MPAERGRPPCSGEAPSRGPPPDEGEPPPERRPLASRSSPGRSPPRTVSGAPSWAAAAGRPPGASGRSGRASVLPGRWRRTAASAFLRRWSRAASRSVYSKGASSRSWADTTSTRSGDDGRRCLSGSMGGSAPGDGRSAMSTLLTSTATASRSGVPVGCDSALRRTSTPTWPSIEPRSTQRHRSGPTPSRRTVRRARRASERGVGR